MFYRTQIYFLKIIKKIKSEYLCRYENQKYKENAVVSSQFLGTFVWEFDKMFPEMFGRAEIYFQTE